MTVKINADTSDGLKFVSDTSGAIDLQSNGTTKASLDASGNLNSVGKLSSTAQSMAEAVSDASAVTINSSTATAIASVSITTTGKPVLLIASGNSNPGQTGGFFLYRLYRDSTEIGKRHKAENGGTSSQNFVFAINHIDTPSAGTYTYSIQAYQGSGTHTFGEDGDVEAAIITACELL
tara:strand:- start:342 stop:875 length:534 start_codon:yes stop_codon:yes gene_type:complete